MVLLQSLDLGRVLVDAGDVVAEIRETCAGDEADITRTDHRYAHADAFTFAVIPNLEPL